MLPPITAEDTDQEDYFMRPVWKFELDDGKVYYLNKSIEEVTARAKSMGRTVVKIWQDME